MIELRNVTRRFGLTTLAIKGLDLTVQDREFLVLYGPAGAGKSTTLKMIAGIVRPTSGDILRDGQSLLGVPPERRDMAMCFENYALYSHLSVFENLAFPLRAKGVADSEIQAKVTRIAETLGIPHLLERRPGFLSGGQRQRVALGRAIIRPASTYLLDEPIGHLDAKLRHRMRAELKAMARDLASTIVLTTTSSREALALGDRIAVLDQGVLQQLGTPEEIYHRPVNEFVASFVGEPPMSFLDATVEQEGGQPALRLRSGHRLPVGPGWAAPLRGSACRLGVRAAELSIADQADDRHAVPVTVDQVELLGHVRVVRLGLGQELIAVVVPPERHLVPGQPLWLAIDPARLHVFQDGRAVSHPAMPTVH
ncbi:ABC transporter ATP-binding protein [Geminicoccus harenae]|uniref:ABC transporter ATP-binding protein n=1 Tax=Geminicoccus harenae TaxID=2498453 RepID=UPI00168AC967|nr:ABC transporter ATP-binding protein [Geminicoccus harenae]